MATAAITMQSKLYLVSNSFNYHYSFQLLHQSLQLQWKAEKPTLTDINLDIPVGSLVAIVGGTEEGKTSLITAMLGELPSRSPDTSATIRGSVAYMPQVSWIFNATLVLPVRVGVASWCCLFVPIRYRRFVFK